MDDNTTKVVLTAMALPFVLAITRRFDRVSLRIAAAENRHLRIPENSTNLLNVAMQRRRPKRREVNHGDDIARVERFSQGSFALANGITVVLGNHDFNKLVITHSDDDHLYGLRHLLRGPHRGSH